MGRILALDMGEKRVGLAISDPLGVIAQPLKTIQRQSNNQLISELKKVIGENAVEKVVIGNPMRLNGDKSRMTIAIEEIISRLREEISIPMVFEDERFTTRMAISSLHQMGKKVGKARDKIDQIAAAHILQLYLERKRR